MGGENNRDTTTQVKTDCACALGEREGICLPMPVLCNSSVLQYSEPLEGCAILSDTAWALSLLYLSIQTCRQAVKII